MAGRLRLAVTGIQDQWLTGEPKISYFSSIYKRHTRFSTEAVSIPITGNISLGGNAIARIPNNVGDLLRSVILKLTLGELPNVTAPGNLYNASPSTSVIQYVDLVIGGQTIQRLTGDYIDLYNQLHSNKDDANTTLYYMNGHNNQIQIVNTPKTFYLNLPFYFFRNPSLAIPICAITRQLIEIHVKFRDADDDVTFRYEEVSGNMVRTKTNIGSIVDASIIADFYFITRDEINFLITRPMEYVITQQQLSTMQFKPNESKKSALLKFTNPVKELLFLAKEETGTTHIIPPFYTISDPVATFQAQGGSVISNNGLVAVTYDNGSTGEVNIYEKDSSGNWPSTASATYTGSTGDYFGRVLGVSDDGTRVAIQSASKIMVVEKQSTAWAQIGSDITATFSTITGSCMTGDGTKVFGSCSIPDPVATTWTQLGSSINGQSSYDYTGWSVSISSDGTRAAIGAYGNPTEGRVMVFEESGGTWTQVGSDIIGELSNDGGQDYSGWSVSLSGDGSRLAIGAIHNSVSFVAYPNTNPNQYKGHVRVYAESGGTWSQVGADIDGEDAYDYSGWSVSLSDDGTRVAIGTYGNDDNGNNAGHVRVYSESSGTWTQMGTDIDGEAAEDQSGWSVSLSGDGLRLAIGARYNDGGGSSSGHVRVYSESGGTWTQLGSDIDGGAQFDYSGWSVSMSYDGTRLAIGAPGASHLGGVGHVAVYAESGGVWTQVGSNIDGEATGDYSGQSVSISSDGTRVAIKDIGADRVRVYSESNGVWTKTGGNIAGVSAGRNPGNIPGKLVSMSGDGTRLMIGDPYNTTSGTNGGQVRIFALTTSTVPAVLSWEYSGSSWSEYRSDIIVNTAVSRISHSTNGEILGLEDVTPVGVGLYEYSTVIYATTDGVSTYTKRHADTEYNEPYHSLSSDGANLVSLGTLGSKVWNGTNYVYDGAGGTQVPWYTTSVDSTVEISRNGSLVFWNDDSTTNFKLYSKSTVNGNVQWTLETSRARTAAVPLKMSALGSDAIIVTGVDSPSNANIYDITYTPERVEDRLLNTSSSDQEFSSHVVGKRSDYRFVKNIRLECNGKTMFDHTGKYLAYEQSLIHHTGCPDAGYEFYMYSFALKPELYYPTGQLNMSRIIHKKLDVELDEVSTTRNINLSIYALNYNVLHVEGGLAGLKF
jgi:predicted lipoprotein with Yx(FWY)xxD motif